MVAEETAPARVAIALPRLITGPVLTAWVGDAPVAQLSLPTQPAPVCRKYTNISNLFCVKVNVMLGEHFEDVRFHAHYRSRQKRDHTISVVYAVKRRSTWKKYKKY